LASREWWSQEKRSLKTQHNGIELTLYPAQDSTTRVCWSWKRDLAPEFTVWTHATADSLDAAAFAAVGYQPLVTEFEYLGQPLIWQSTDGYHWLTVINGDGADVFDLEESRIANNRPRILSDAYYEAHRFLWGRGCATLKAIFDLTDAKKLRGYASTLEQAMAACVEAPDAFRVAACAALSRPLINPQTSLVPTASTKRAKRKEPAPGGAR